MRFLIVKTSAIGDVIQSFPVLEYLRARFPDAQIDWVVERGGSALVAAHPAISSALPIHTHEWRDALWKKKSWQEMGAFLRTLRESRYDVLFDLQGNVKSLLINRAARAREKVGFDKDSVAEKISLLSTNRRIAVSRNLPLRTRYLQLVQSYFSDSTPFVAKPVTLILSSEEQERLDGLDLPHPVLMVAFGAKWKNKRLKSITLQALIQRIQETFHPYFLFIYGNGEEKELAEHLHGQHPKHSLTVGKLSLPLWQALMRRVDGVIAMDSAALHLCGTTETPSFSFFGPSSSALYKPGGGMHVAFQGSCPYGMPFIQRCLKLRTCPTGACLRDVPVEELMSPFAEWYRSLL